jgi:DNA-binding LacI/PurR family transcriptional regulator
MPSLKDVARLAGVSESTVSRTLNRSIPVDEKTRARVEDAVRKLNYRPNLLAKGLRARSGRLIGLIMPEIIHFTFADLIQEIDDCSRARGYSLIVAHHKGDAVLEEAIIDTLIRRHVDGIIFSRGPDESREKKLITDSGVPAVVIDCAFENEEHGAVVLDNYRAGMMAGEHLTALGHTRIACVTGPLRIALSRERLKGFRDALAGRGVTIEENFVIEGDFRFESGVRAAQLLFQQGSEPSAIWAQNDDMAVGVLKHLGSIGLSVPGDVSLVGMNDSSLARMTTPGLTTVAQPYSEMARQAVSLVLSLKQQDRTIPERITLNPSLVIRESTARV